MLLNLLSNVFLPPWLGKIVTLVMFRSLVNACETQEIDSKDFHSYSS